MLHSLGLVRRKSDQYRFKRACHRGCDTSGNSLTVDSGFVLMFRRILHHVATVHRARLPGEIPPISVPKAANASAADTAAGTRDTAGSSGAFMYIRTATRM